MLTWFKPVRTLSNIPSLLHASHMKCVERLRCDHWDCGWCFHPDSKGACPGWKDCTKDKEAKTEGPKKEVKL